MTAGLLIFLFVVLVYVSEKKGGRWEAVIVFVTSIVIGVPLFVIIGGFVSTFTIGLPLSYVISESALDAISVRSDDGKIGLWTLPSMIPWGVIGWLEIMAANRIWRGWQRKRDKAQAIEEEIRTVSEIKIIEPSPPDAVERFYGSEGPIEKFFGRYFSWTESARDKLGELLEALPLSVKCVGILTVGFVVGSVTLWIRGLSFQEGHWGLMIPFAILVGFVSIYCAMLLVWAGALVILLPLAIPYYTWRIAKSVNSWLAQNLPRGLVWRYRSWQLRRTGRRLRRDASTPST